MARAAIGEITSVAGKATVIHADGSSELLVQGAAVFPDDTITTAANGSVRIDFQDGTGFHLGADTTTVLDTAVYDPLTNGFVRDDSGLFNGDPAPGEGDAEAVRAAILAGEDPTEITAAPAAGEVAEDNEGSNIVVVEATRERLTPESGHDTHGFELSFTTPDEELLQSPEEPLLISVIPESITGDVVTEGQALVFTVELSRPHMTADVSASWTLDLGTASFPDLPEDVVLSGTVTIPAGSTSTTIEIPSLDDSLFEGGPGSLEGLTITLGDVINAEPGQVVAAGFIEDNDQLTISIGDGSPSPALEGTDGTITFEVTLSNPADQPVTVDYTTVNDTAIAGQDYTAASGTLTFAAGETSKTITVTVLNDEAFEDLEAFTVDVANAVYAPGTADATGLIIADNSGSASIVDDDRTSVYISDGTPNPAIEGPEGFITFTVTLTNPSTIPVTVDYSTSNGMAIAGEDYVAASDTLTFAAGETSKTITVTVLNDAVFEDPEAFTVDISNADAGGTALAITDSSGTGNIVDEDQPTVAIADGSPSPALEGTDGTITFEVILSNPSDQPVTVDYSTSNGTAIAGEDYVAASDALIFAAGETSKTITVTVLNDAIFEDPEAFTVDISNADAGGTALAITDSSGTGNIVDEDQPTVAIADGSPSPALEGTDGTITFEVTLSNPADQPVTVDYTTVNDTAIAGQDYTAASGTLTFAAGETSKTITVTVLNDEAFEDLEAFTVDVANAVYAPGTADATGLIIADNSGSASIVDDDRTSVYISDGTPNPAIEGPEGFITFTVTLTNPSTIPVTVDYSTSNGTAIAGEDYVAAGDTLTFAAGETSKTITVTVLNDAVFEDPEAFTVDISNADAGGTALAITDSSGTGNIVDEDQPTVAIADGSPSPALEGTDGTITFEVTLSNPADQPVTVDYSTSNGTAIAGEDYVAASDTLTFAAGETSKTITVTVLNDAIFEDPEAFTVDISNADAGGTALAITDSSGTGNIVDEDQPTVAIADGSPSPALEGTDGTITFEVTLSNPADQPVTVDYSTSNGMAIAGKDYVAASDTLIFAAGETSKTITVTVLNDAIFEDPEAFTVDISNADAGGTALAITDSSGTGNIVDEDQPTVAIADGSPSPALEGTDGTITFEVTLSNPADQPVTVDYSTSNGTAIAGEDYVAASDTLTFAAGETSKTITVTVLNDAVFEDPEAFTVDISNADAGGTALAITDSSGTGNIVDEDQPTVAIADGSPSPALEGTDGTITFEVTLSNPSDQPVTVDYSTSNGTAIAGEDYVAASDTLTFAAGETSKTITVTVLNDAIFEDPEAFTVDISNADAGGTALAITDSSGTGNIVDEDQPTVAIADGSPSPALEGTDGTITFEVTLSNPADQPVTVDYSTSNGTAIAGEDYVAASDTLTFAAGETSKTITVTVLNDAVFEDPEAFTVDISNADAGGTALAITDSSGTGNIVDEDQPTVAIADGSPSPALEGTDGTITFEVILSNPADQPVTVDYSTSNSTAIAGEDYVAASDTLIFAAGETSKTITVTVLNDAIFEDPEAFTVDISNADAGGTALAITDSSGTGNIVDEDQPTVAIADGSPSPALEGTDGTITFEVTLSNPADQPVTVDYSTSNGTAIAGEDYVAASDTLTFAAGETSKTITVTVLNDAIFEDPEAFTVDISNADAGGTALAITDSSGTGNIVDDDHIPVANNDSNWVQEDGVVAVNGNVLLTISHPGASTGSFSDLADTDADGDSLAITNISNGTENITPDANGEIISGKYGTLSISSTGSYSYTLDNTNSTVDALGEGDTLTDEVFTYTVTDGANTPQTAILSITIFGTNDAPVANPDNHYVDEGINGDAGNITGVVLQDADHGMDSSVSTNGAESYADVQDTDSEAGTLSVISVSSNATADSTNDLVADSSVQGQYGTLTMNSDGTYVYDLDDGNPVVDALNVGDEVEETFTYTIQDAGGLTQSTTLSVTINGQNDRAVFNAGTYVWLPVALDQMAPEYQDGYPIDLPVADVDSTLTIEITGVPDEGVAGYYNGGTFIPLDAGDTFELAIGEPMPVIFYVPPAVDLETQVDPVVDIVSFTVTEGGDSATTTSGTITINAMPPFELPGQEAQIGNGSEPLTSGRDLEAALVLDTNLVNAISTDLADDGVINSSYIELFTDFQSRPASGGVPIPDDHRADQALEDTVTATITVDGIEFVVINENDGINQWTYDADTGLMTAIVDYNDVMDLATGTTSLADHLVSNQPATGDIWTVTYNDSDGGNEQARFIKFNFTYENPGDPSVNITGDEFSPNIMFGTSGNDVLTGGNVGDRIFGREGDDEINGLAGNDILVGGGGDDIIVGGGGADEIYGGEGADTFVINSLSDGDDTVVNYDDGESDVLDISDILTGYDVNNDDISDFVNLTADGADVVVSVDPTGTGSFTDIAVLSNLVGNTVTFIVDQDNNSETLIVA